MGIAERYKCKSNERTPVVLLARIRTIDGVYATQALLTSVTYSVYEARAPLTVVTSDTLVKADCIFDTLQINTVLWLVDEIGFNFKQKMPKACLPARGIYIITVKFTPVTGDPFFVEWEVDAQQIVMI